MPDKWSEFQQYLEDNGIIVPDSLLQLAKFMMKNPTVLLGESEKAPRMITKGNSIAC